VRGEGHSAAGCGVGRSVELLLWDKSPLVQAMGGR